MLINFLVRTPQFTIHNHNPKISHLELKKSPGNGIAESVKKAEFSDLKV